MASVGSARQQLAGAVAVAVAAHLSTFRPSFKSSAAASVDSLARPSQRCNQPGDQELCSVDAQFQLCKESIIPAANKAPGPSEALFGQVFKRSCCVLFASQAKRVASLRNQFLVSCAGEFVVFSLNLLLNRVALVHAKGKRRSSGTHPVLLSPECLCWDMLLFFPLCSYQRGYNLPLQGQVIASVPVVA